MWKKSSKRNLGGARDSERKWKLRVQVLGLIMSWINSTDTVQKLQNSQTPPCTSFVDPIPLFQYFTKRSSLPLCCYLWDFKNRSLRPPTLYSSMDRTAPSPSLSTQEPTPTNHPNPTVENDCNPKTINKRKKKRVFKDTAITPPPSQPTSSSSSSSSSSSVNKSPRVSHKHRSPKVVFAPVRRRGGIGDDGVEAIALPLGMSFAAVVAQVSSIFCFFMRFRLKLGILAHKVWNFDVASSLVSFFCLSSFFKAIRFCICLHWEIF